MVPRVLTKKMNTQKKVKFVYVRRHGTFYVKVNGKTSTKLQGFYFKVQKFFFTHILSSCKALTSLSVPNAWFPLLSK